MRSPLLTKREDVKPTLPGLRSERNLAAINKASYRIDSNFAVLINCKENKGSSNRSALLELDGHFPNGRDAVFYRCGGVLALGEISTASHKPALRYTEIALDCHDFLLPLQPRPPTMTWGEALDRNAILC